MPAVVDSPNDSDVAPDSQPDPISTGLAKDWILTLWKLLSKIGQARRGELGDLPSEAQWEAAARGTDGRRYPWGDEKPSAELANFDRTVGKTTPVGSYAAGAGPYGTGRFATSFCRHLRRRGCLLSTLQAVCRQSVDTFASSTVGVRLYRQREGLLEVGAIRVWAGCVDTLSACVDVTASVLTCRHSALYPSVAWIFHWERRRPAGRTRSVPSLATTGANAGRGATRSPRLLAGIAGVPAEGRTLARPAGETPALPVEDKALRFRSPSPRRGRRPFLSRSRTPLSEPRLQEIAIHPGDVVD